MSRHARQYGFSLTETLMAVGTLAIGMMFVGGTFMTGIYFSTVSTERTVAAVAADEAFVKLRLYGLDPNKPGPALNAFSPYEQVAAIPAREFLYPSLMENTERQYSWAALCRRISTGSDRIQCIVLVSRKTGVHSTYWVRQGGLLIPSDIPRPLLVKIVKDASTPAANDVSVRDDLPGDNIDELAFVNEGSILIDDTTGEIYHVLARSASLPGLITMDRPWIGGAAALPAGGWAWVVPPATSGGRNPVIGVYQQVLRFPGE